MTTQRSATNLNTVQSRVSRKVQRGTTVSYTVPPLSDEPLALYFSDLHRNDLRYTALWGKWSLWDGKRWRQDESLLGFDMARALCRRAAAELAALRAQKQMNAVERSPLNLASASTVAAVERLARSSRNHAMTADQWDCDLWALNTRGGTIDLRTGKMRAHAFGDHITKITAAAPGGQCPMWLQFLARITAGDGEFQRFLQRVAGYSLTGSTREHALFFLYGAGANGKSVFINTLSGLMGDYAKTAPIETFIASRQERHPTDLAGLRGARLVSAVETEEGRRWAEAKLKQLTGGDRIAARFMRQDFFEFDPQFKLLIAGNHKPSLRSVDEAIRRRLHLLPFDVTIPERERDKDLPEKLKSERGGILAWMIEGCLAWQRQGLNPPAIVREATADYLAEEDVVGQWVGDRCLLGSTLSATFAVLFADWRQWCLQNDEDPGSFKQLSQRLQAHGFSRRRSSSAHKFSGIALKNDTPGVLPDLSAFAAGVTDVIDDPI